ncbi:hypothetical protein BWI15_12400 [Kribbella sp. ALI-6-A]|uniref:beta family protein n=1 Tax=Kribbella sp. ALI-6-A TaxID=1933817 RepID=UPI00097C26C7|nr:hypothetical protein [Kribbella sp. ALI-6-A]ONI74158.1 hypothetical protein BWI15_12400 [Kribbella sp. ALI-6-A]
MNRASAFRSLVALRAKGGEFAALDVVPDGFPVQPLLCLDYDPNVSTTNLLDRVTDVTRRLAAMDRLVMLDATGLSAAPQLVGGAAGILGDLADRLSFPPDLFESPATFIPVVRLDATDDQLARIGRLADEMGTGYAVRLRPADLGTEPLSGLLRRLPGFLDRLPGDLDVVDLILDLVYLPAVDQRLVETTATILDAVRRWGSFRSTTLLSGSVPKTLNQTDLWEQPRYEELLWRAVVDAGMDDVLLGDYGVTHPVFESGGWPSKHISVKYTCADHWLYLRERIREPDEENSRTRTVRLVSRHLVASGSFAGPDYSWGDRQFAEAANGAGSALGATTKPVAFATSHHLAYHATRAAA